MAVAVYTTSNIPTSEREPSFQILQQAQWRQNKRRDLTMLPCIEIETALPVNVRKTEGTVSAEIIIL
jgi:hypothetical protein